MPKSGETAPRSGLAVFKELLAVEMQFGWTRWFGFACTLIWIFGLYWNSSSSLSLARYFSYSLGGRDLWLGSEAITLLLVFLVMRRFNSLLSTNAARWFSGLLVACGSALAIFGNLAHASDLLVVSGIIMTGAGSALLMALWGVALSQRGPQALLISIGFALIIAAVLDFCLIYVPSAAQIFCIVGFPIASSALLVLSTSDRVLNAATPFILGTPRASEDARALSWRVVLLPAFVGLAYGLMQQLASAHQAPLPAVLTDLRTISAFFLSGAVLLITTLFFSQDRVTQRIYFIALPIMVTTFLVLPILQTRIGDLQTVFIIGFNCFYFMVWALWSGYSDESPASVSRRFVLGLLVLIGSEALGLFLGSLVVQAQTTMNIPLSTVSILVVYALLMDALFASNQLFGGRLSFGKQGKRDEAAVETFSESEAAPHLAESGETALYEHARTVAIAHGLSSREQDVLMLLVKGRTKAYISKTLYISDNTTCTHMKNVYRKMGVHSHQELLDLIEVK